MGLWSKLKFDNGTDSYEYEDVEGFTVDEEGNRVDLASGISKRRDVAYGLTGTIWEADAFTQILPFMEANDDLEITVTLDDGTTHVFHSCRALLTPALSPVPDISSVHISDAGSTDGDPDGDTTGNWTELGATVGASEPEATANAVELGEGNKQHYSDAALVHDMELSGDQTANFSSGEKDIAIEHPDGGYRIYRGVWVDKPIFIPRPQTQEIDVTLLHLEGAAGKFSDILEFPSAPEDLFYGVAFEISKATRRVT